MFSNFLPESGKCWQVFFKPEKYFQQNKLETSQLKTGFPGTCKIIA